MRKIILIIAALFMALVLSGCSYERLFEVGEDVNTFNYAFIKVGNTVEKVKIKDRYIKVKIKDRYINDHNGIIIVTTDDNKVYYTHSSNIILLNE